MQDLSPSVRASRPPEICARMMELSAFQLHVSAPNLVKWRWLPFQLKGGWPDTSTVGVFSSYRVMMRGSSRLCHFTGEIWKPCPKHSLQKHDRRVQNDKAGQINSPHTILLSSSRFLTGDSECSPSPHPPNERTKANVNILSLPSFRGALVTNHFRITPLLRRQGIRKLRHRAK